MKTINLTRKFAVFLAALILVSAVLGAVVTRTYFPQTGIIKGAGPEDPLEAYSESSVIIWQYNSTFYGSRNMSTNMVTDLLANLTNVEKYALGNITNGLLYLIEVQHNTSLTITATQIVAQQYSGKLTYFTDTGSSSPTDCPVATTSTFTLTSDTSEHTIVTLTPTSVEQVTNFYLDLSELTQNCTLRVYLKIDGVNYVELTGMTVMCAAGTKGMPLKDHVIDTAWKLTIQSTVAEGASRDIDYRYFVNVY
jgi:hypothetical protein